jgi:hypothetical protein
LLPYSNCVHYDVEPARRVEYHRLVGEDGVALHFCGTRLQRVLSSRPGAHAYRVYTAGAKVLKDPLEVDCLAGKPTIKQVAAA